VRDVAGLIPELPRRPADKVPGVLVVAPAGSAATSIGRALSARLHGDFAAVRAGELARVISRHPGMSHVMLIARHDEMSLEMVTDSLNVLSDRRDVGFGFMTGRTMSDISWLIAKGLSCHMREVPDRADLCVVPWISQSTRTRPGLEWAVGDRGASGLLKPALYEQRRRLVSFATAGREHALILSDTVVCGSDSNRSPDDLGAGALPSCALTGYCFRDDITTSDVIEADRIRADVIYANSCMAWRPGHGTVAPEYQLTNAFQRGIAAAFIGAIHQMMPNLKLNDLVHSAAADGVSVGRIGMILNDYARATSNELPYFAVLGLPWITLSTETQPPATAAAEVPGLHVDRATVSITRSKILETGDDPADHDDIRTELQRIGRIIQALRELPLYGFMPADDFGAVDTKVHELARAIKKAHLGAEPRSVAIDIFEELRCMVAEIELRAVGDFQEFGQMSHSGINEIWEGILQTRAYQVDSRCVYCGGRLARLTGQHPVHEGIRRLALVCNVCGPVVDLPHVPAISSIVINCQSVWESPGAVTIEILISTAETLSRKITIAAAAYISGATKYGMPFPEPQQISLQPGSPGHMSVHAKLSEDVFPHHQHFIRVVLVAEGLVHYASRPVSVWPQIPHEISDSPAG
jgi:hypothetical protein